MPHTKRILLTGASGFVGSNFLKYLSENQRGNIAVRALIHRRNVEHKSPVIETVRGDVRDYRSLKEAFAGAPLDGIVHLAAVIKSPCLEDYEEVNVEGTKNLVRLSETHGVKKFIFISSDFVLYEDVAPNPYGVSKRKCEEIIHASKLDFTIFRPTPIFGPGDMKNFATLAAVVKKYPVLPAVKCYMEPVYVGDVAKMIVAVLESAKANRETYYLPGGAGYSFDEILRIISRRFGLKRYVVSLPPKLFLSAVKLYEFLIPHPLLESYQVKKWLCTRPLDASKTKEDLEYDPISLEEGASFIGV